LSSRTDEIIRNLDRANSELVEFLTDVTGPELQTPCEDPSGATVGAIVAHLHEGAPEVFGWLAGVVAGSGTAAPAASAGGSHGREHGHDHGHEHGHGSQGSSGDPAAVIEMMRAGRPLIVDLVSRLTDELLDSRPPAADGITDGTRTLAEVLSDMLDHQAQHVAYMRKALAGQPATPARDAG